MPYCPKCGVELDRQVKNCPLCQFPIPNIDDASNDLQEDIFPKAQNIYEERVTVLKNKIFFTIVLLLSVTIPILITLQTFLPSIAGSIGYAIIGILSAIFYLFFLFGYLSLYSNILGISLTSILLTYLLDTIDDEMTWFSDVALYIILLATVLAYLYTYLYKRSKHRNQFVYIPTYFLSATGLLCIAMETIISYKVNNSIQLTWSLIVLISTFGICLILLGLYHGLPDKVKAKLKRRLHV